MNFRFTRKIVLVLAGLFLLMGSFVFATTILRVSEDNADVVGNSYSTAVSISEDGQYVAFSSVSTNIVAGDTNALEDVFVYDRQSDTVERVSIDDLGNEADGVSTTPSISADGRYVAFVSSATNLVSGDTNGLDDIFVYDRQNDTVERVSIDDLGNEADGASRTVSISGDGRYVSFASDATNLLPGDTNGVSDIFVYERETTDTIERVSLDSSENEVIGASYFPRISEDGLYVVFASDADDLVSGDNNAVTDIFVRDRDNGITERVSVNDLGVEGDSASGSSSGLASSISSDGQYVAFESDAANLVSGDSNSNTDVFVYDRNSNTIEIVSVDDLGNEGDSFSYSPSISGDGRYVAFYSGSTNLVSGDTNGNSDIFVRDRNFDATKRVSVDSSGAEVFSNSSLVDISEDGEYLTFLSGANIVSGDTNDENDVFLRTVNDDPTDISLSSDSVDEEESSGTNVGTLTTTDLDIGDSHTYTLACAVPGADDASFSISGDSLLTTAVFDFETKSSYDICVRSDDGNGGIFDKNFTITILNVTEGLGGSSILGSGSQAPMIRIRDNLTQTNSRLVDLEVWTAVSVTSYEISNTPDFTVKETFNRESLMKLHSWDICKGLTGCASGNKKIYARFYMGSKILEERMVEIDYTISRECPYFKGYLRKGSKKNVPEEVRKAQDFLNGEMGAKLIIDGIFGSKTERAVKDFQEKYPTQIITPWPGLNHSTGWWYITTSSQANHLVGC